MSGKFFDGVTGSLPDGYGEFCWCGRLRSQHYSLLSDDSDKRYCRKGSDRTFVEMPEVFRSLSVRLGWEAFIETLDHRTRADHVLDLVRSYTAWNDKPMISTFEHLPQAVTMLIERKDGYILAVSRKEDHTLFGLPGGKVDEGETLKQAAIRETKEEVGLDCLAVTPYFTKVCVGRGHGTRPGQSYLNTTFYCDLYKGTPQSMEDAAMEWLRPEALWQVGQPYAEYNRALFAYLREQRELNG